MFRFLHQMNALAPFGKDFAPKGLPKQRRPCVVALSVLVSWYGNIKYWTSITKYEVLHIRYHLLSAARNMKYQVIENDSAQQCPASVQLVRVSHQKLSNAFETYWLPGLAALSVLAFRCGGIKHWVAITRYWELQIKCHFVSVGLSMNYQVHWSTCCTKWPASLHLVRTLPGQAFQMYWHPGMVCVCVRVTMCLGNLVRWH